MDIKILIDFVEKFRGKDIDKKFNHLKAYKKVHMLESSSGNTECLEWVYK